MTILVDDSAETVLSVYGEAFDLIGFKRLGTGQQGCCGSEIVMTERYCWEGATHDCSLPAALNVHILTSAPAALFSGLHHHEGPV